MNSQVNDSKKSANHNPYQTFYVLCIATAICTYISSLFVTSLFTNTGEILGVWVLITGWLGIIFFQLAWLANPLNLIAILIAKERPKLSILLSAIAILLASKTFLLFEIPAGISLEKIYITELGSGFFLWYFSNILFLVSFISFALGNQLYKRNREEHSIPLNLNIR